MAAISMIPIFLIGIVLFLYFVPLGLWIQSGVSIGWGKIGMIKLVIMRIRKISPKLITDGIINLHRAGLTFVSSEDLETHFLAGGNISNVVERAVEFYKMSDKNLNLKVVIDKKQNFSIKGDSDQLYRVFLNLIKNSIEAIEEKKQKDKNLQGKIVVEIDRNNEYIVIKMLDNGPGFNDINNITKPYYTTKTKGTGLGLPIVSKIINEHNGDINFLKKTSGAIIEIYLPAI